MNVSPAPRARPAAALLLCLLLWAAACASPAGRSTDPTVPLWERWEESFTATSTAGEDVALTVTLTPPSGRTRVVDGFWDGGQLWRVRFLADEPGTWRYRTESIPAVPGLHGREGGFTVRAGGGSTPLTRHGAVRVSADGRHLAHADGTPFLWLGDTGWGAALKSSDTAWSAYLADRAAKGFTVVQLVTTQWRAAHTNAEGEVAYTGYDDIRINPAFFRRMDRRMDELNRAGLVAAPVLLWTLGDSLRNPGKLPEDQAARLARYLVARYQGHHVVWILAGDENYARTAERWRRIGRAVFDRPGHAPVTLHPQGMQWSWGALLDEPWLSLLIYQSGHGDDARTLSWLHSGPPATEWSRGRPRPVLNSEPPYEDHVAYQSRRPHTAYSVRRAVYWSLLNTPTAGVTYGAHGVWSWEAEPAVPLEHPGSGVARPWHEAMRLPGSEDIRRVAALLAPLEWWRLRPARALVQGQPEDPARFVGAAATEAGDLAVLYLPVGGTVRLDPASPVTRTAAVWFNPRTGARLPARAVGPATFAAPDTLDWVLVLGRG